MTEAIFGLLGVVVGAVITGGFEVWREARQRRREIRAAVRVGYIGGVYAAEAVTEALHTKKWPPSIPFDRTHLAPHLERIAALGDELAFQAVFTIDAAVAVIEMYRSEGRSPTDTDVRKDLVDAQKELNGVLDTLMDAEQSLRPLSRLRPPRFSSG